MDSETLKKEGENMTFKEQPLLMRCKDITGVENLSLR